VVQLAIVEQVAYRDEVPVAARNLVVYDHPLAVLHGRSVGVVRSLSGAWVVAPEQAEEADDHRDP
jgi:hypothetical protein